jgi:selenocysteine-specific elongation factor
VHVVGTAGHVDHGKSTLIEALTGRNPDRLAEEQRRGLTIDLGFAWTTLPSGREVGFVDVPGHRRFLRNMLAGVGSVDAVLFVVAANEGWMPQSEEHHRILRFLGVRPGLVALTKVDLVEPDVLALAHEEVAERVGPGWRIVEVAAPAGVGLDELRTALDELLAAVPSSPDVGRPRLWVDRCFTIRGAGTVVTGTLTGGSFSVDERVTLLPRGERARIRTVHTHEVERPVASPGSRVALNLVGVEPAGAGRGDAVVHAEQWKLTQRFDAVVEAALGAELRAKGAYVLHVGTADVATRLQLAKGGGFARFRPASSLPLVPGDRFVLRDTGTQQTVGGGRVLDVDPEGPLDEARLTRRARSASGADLVDVLLAERGWVPEDDVEPLTGARGDAGSRRGRESLGGYVLTTETSQELIRRAQDAVRRHHAHQPAEPGIPGAQLRAELGVPPSLLAALLARSDLVVDGDLVRRSDHRVLSEVLMGRLAATGLAPPPATEVGVSTRVLASLAREGSVVTAGQFVYRREDYDRACEIVRARIDADGPQTVAALRDALGVTRRHALPLLERMDADGVTRRTGDLRA